METADTSEIETRLGVFIHSGTMTPCPEVFQSERFLFSVMIIFTFFKIYKARYSHSATLGHDCWAIYSPDGWVYMTFSAGSLLLMP
jgi:hypothetical protein